MWYIYLPPTTAKTSLDQQHGKLYEGESNENLKSAIKIIIIITRLAYTASSN